MAYWKKVLILTGAALVLGPAVAAGQQLTEEERFRELRNAMVRDQIEAKGVSDSETLRAMRNVPRHLFVAEPRRANAYEDRPLPIEEGQTISQPYIVGYMTEIIGPRPGMKILEIGTGSGYQAAVLAETGAQVFSIEIFAFLAAQAANRLDGLGYRVQVRHADGFDGWPEEAPFDAIIVTAAAGFIPPPLLDQLKPGGRMIIPVGSIYGIQNLVRVDKREDGSLQSETLLPVRFVPLLRSTG